MPEYRVAVLGATGMVGQRFVSLLEGHPWFRLTAVAASDRSVGKPYEEAVRWVLEQPMPEAVRRLTVQPCEPGLEADLVFSALPTAEARDIEEGFARAGYAISTNASPWRMDPLVPLLVTEVNPDHLGLLQAQAGRWPGKLVANPNCSAIHLLLALKPLHDAFGLKAVQVTTLQALSGAGYPGVSALDVADNVLNYIPGEEEKLESEPLKILGRLANGHLVPADVAISAQCHRVAVREGHLEAVSVRFDRAAKPADVAEVLRDWRARPQRLGLPSAPKRPVVVREENYRPQPRLDREAEGGMATVVGRIRPCPLLDVKFSLLGHNTIRGGAGGAILNAELLVAEGYL